MSWSRLREILTLHRRTWQMWVLWKEPDTNHLKNVTEFSVIFHWEEFSLPQMGKTWPLSTTSLLKRRPPVWKLGLLLLRGGGHGSPPLPPQPTADQKNTGVLLSCILCSVAFIFPLCKVLPSALLISIAPHSFLEGRFEWTHWVLLSDLWITCWGDWEACERAKLPSWWLLSPVRHMVSAW